MLPQTAFDDRELTAYIGKEKGFDARTITRVRVLRRSIDARQRTIYVNLKVRVFINEQPSDDEYQKTEYPDVSSAPRVVVVGAGPAGLFAALRLIEHGLRPVVIERGKDVRERKKDLAQITKTHKVDSESNYGFGEGGAGAYSDGKLYTRSKKRGSVEKILNVFCQFGAPLSILADAHPHIGTDKLPRVIENMRKQIILSGGEVRFQTRMERLIIQGDSVEGVEATNLVSGAQETFRGPVILATGHSARDVYRYLASAKVEIEAKGLAIGVRLEHPSALIDRIQYHNKDGRGKYLPAAEYSFVTQVDGRGVYSFCMCPGGFVIPAATGSQQIVVNGMSPSNRGGQWSNSGMVVEIHPEDLAAPGAITEVMQGILEEEADSLAADAGSSANTADAGSSVNSSDNSYFANTGVASEIKTGVSAPLKSQISNLQSPLAMMYYQEALERVCWQQGNMRQTAPAQRMADFVNNRLSYDLPKSSYAPGLISSPLHFWLPPFISKRLQQGFLAFGSKSHGFLTNDAVMMAVETRTSSPVRILRDADSLCHVRLKGLYPAGEGAGYAGGIVSAGIDGERCADACAAALAALN